MLVLAFFYNKSQTRSFIVHNRVTTSESGADDPRQRLTRACLTRQLGCGDNTQAKENRKHLLRDIRSNERGFSTMFGLRECHKNPVKVS